MRSSFFGMARAMELSLMGERLPAQEALQIGLCNRVVARKDLDDFGMKFAARVATGPTKMMSMTRKLYWSSYNNTYEEQMAQEARFQNVAGASKDAGIGDTQNAKFGDAQAANIGDMQDAMKRFEVVFLQEF